MKTVRIFSIYLSIIGLSAVFGGWMIMYTDWMHFPPDILSTTPFSTFLIPGLILALIVGGTQFLAAILLWMKRRLRYEAMAVAGFSLLIWICAELFLIPSHHWIQIVYLGFAIMTLIGVMVLLKYDPSKSTS